MKLSNWDVNEYKINAKHAISSLREYQRAGNKNFIFTLNFVLMCLQFSSFFFPRRFLVEFRKQK